MIRVATYTSTNKTWVFEEEVVEVEEEEVVDRVRGQSGRRPLTDGF